MKDYQVQTDTQTPSDPDKAAVDVFLSDEAPQENTEETAVGCIWVGVTGRTHHALWEKTTEQMVGHPDGETDGRGSHE